MNNISKKDDYSGINIIETAIKLQTNKGKTIDIGCADGKLITHLAKKGINITGLDKERIYKGRKKFIKQDLNKKVKIKEKYDTVYCLEVIEHLENPVKLIRDIHRILKPEGELIISTPNLTNWYNKIYYLITGTHWRYHNEEDGHITPLNKKQIKQITKKLFKIEKITYNRSIIPIIRTKIPLKNNLTGENIIIRMRKK